MDMDRFKNHTDSSNPHECWVWNGSIQKRTGYGYFRMAGKSQLAHRASWMIFKGKIPQTHTLRHACHNPSCVNPNHLYKVRIKSKITVADHLNYSISKYR